MPRPWRRHQGYRSLSLALCLPLERRRTGGCNQIVDIGRGAADADGTDDLAIHPKGPSAREGNDGKTEKRRVSGRESCIELHGGTTEENNAPCLLLRDL